MKNKFLLSSLVVFLILVGSIVFIKNNNDHKECSVVIETTKDLNGNTITLKKHICKEKYNF